MKDDKPLPGDIARMIGYYEDGRRDGLDLLARELEQAAATAPDNYPRDRIVFKIDQILSLINHVRTFSPKARANIGKMIAAKRSENTQVH